MDKLTAIKIKYDDGTYSDEIPVSVLSENVEWDSTHTLVDVLGSIDVDVTGTIQDQISQLFNEKVSASAMQAAMQDYVTNSMPTYITNWLNTNVNPVGSAVVVDSSLTVAGAAADAKAVGDELTTARERLQNAEEILGITMTAISFTSGAYIKTGNVGKVGTVIDLTPVASASYRYAIISCDPGDVFAVNLSGGNTPRAWAFLDSNNALLSNSASGTIDADVVVPVNAAKIVLNDRSNGTVYKISGTDKIREIENAVDSLEEVVSGITSPLIRYVSTSGDDANDGNTPNTAYASISKALTEGADVIYIKRGTYTESAIGEINTGYRYKAIRIVADNATLNTPKGIHFRYTDVHISGLNIVIENSTIAQPYGLFILNCTGTLKDCSVSGAPYMGFRLDGSKMTLERCVATGAAVDGFNGHTVNTGYETECTLIDCKAYNNGDDGLSFHERGTMYVEGGEYYSNSSTGIAPHQSCKATIRNAYIHDNGHSGVEFFNPSTDNGYEVVNAMSYGNLYKSNGQYGLNTQYYNVISVNDKFADNTSGTYNQGTGATLEVY